jgi:hypothetical protein
MYKPLCSFLCALALLAAGTASGAPRTLRAIEEAAESPALDIDLESSSAGRVIARLCDQCAFLTLQIDANTTVLLHGAPSTLQTAVARKGQGATVFFDRESLVVKRIVLWD